MIGDTQPQFARRLGISLGYVIAMENGQRRANERIAHAVLQATDIHPKWLLGKMGKKDQPLNIARVPISNPEDARVALEEKANPSQPITDTEELRMIEKLCSEVGAFLRAATRKGSFLNCEVLRAGNDGKDGQPFMLPETHGRGNAREDRAPNHSYEDFTRARSTLEKQT